MAEKNSDGGRAREAERERDRAALGARDVEGPPPFFARWSSLYAVVLGALAVTLVLLVILTRLYDHRP